MLSRQLIRERPDDVRRGLARRGDPGLPLDELIRRDEQRRRALQEVEGLRAERNTLSKEIGELARVVKSAETKDAKHAEHRRSDLVAPPSFLGETLDTLETQLRDLEGDLRDLLLQVPNLPASGVPEGPDDPATVVVETEGEAAQPSFHKTHLELGESLGINGFER